MLTPHVYVFVWDELAVIRWAVSMRGLGVKHGPLWRKYRRSRGRGVHPRHLNRVPREGGENGRQETRPPSSLRATSPRGGRSRRLNLPPLGGSTGAAGVGGSCSGKTNKALTVPSQSHCERSEATQGADTDVNGCCPGLLRRDAPRNDAAGGRWAGYRRSERVWVPAFAGKAGGGKQGPLRPFGPLPPEGEDLGGLNLPPLGEVPVQPG